MQQALSAKATRPAPNSLKALLHAQPTRAEWEDQSNIVENLKLELETFKEEAKVVADAMKADMRLFEKKGKDSVKYLPPFVRSQRHQILHLNDKIFIMSPAAHWKTLCGWHYYHSAYTFEEDLGTKVICSKCEQFARSKGVDFAN